MIYLIKKKVIDNICLFVNMEKIIDFNDANNLTDLNHIHTTFI